MTVPLHPGAAPSRFFLVALLGAITLTFFWLIAPFSGAILWAIIAAVLFDLLNRRLLRAMPQRQNLAAFATLGIITVVVVGPTLLLGVALVREATAFYARLQSGEIHLAQIFVETEARLPAWAQTWLADLGLSDVGRIQTRIAQSLATSIKPVAAQLLGIGQDAFAFFLSLGVMLYLTFFLLRDGRRLAPQIERAIPLAPDQRAMLVAKFLSVIRATIKGSLIVAILQGATGGLVLWALGLPGALLWGVAMGVFSLFPAVGTGLIWVPVTIYLLFTGAIWQGAILFLCGFFIVSSVDNVVRPFLVGRDTRMPDYLVLVATLGGFELMGFNGFVVGPVTAALFLTLWQIQNLAAPSAPIDSDE